MAGYDEARVMVMIRSRTEPLMDALAKLYYATLGSEDEDVQEARREAITAFGIEALAQKRERGE